MSSPGRCDVWGHDYPRNHEYVNADEEREAENVRHRAMKQLQDDLDEALRDKARAELRAARYRRVLEMWAEYRFRCSDTPGATAKLNALLYAAEDATTEALSNVEVAALRAALDGKEGPQ